MLDQSRYVQTLCTVDRHRGLRVGCRSRYWLGTVGFRRDIVPDVRRCINRNRFGCRSGSVGRSGGIPAKISGADGWEVGRGTSWDSTRNCSQYFPSVPIFGSSPLDQQSGYSGTSVGIAPKIPPPQGGKVSLLELKVARSNTSRMGPRTKCKKKATNVDLILRTKVQTLGGIYKHFASTRSDRLVSPVVLERCCQCA